MDNEQDKLNAAMKQHLEHMILAWFFIKYACCMAVIAGGFLFMLRTKLAFGDVPMILGFYWLSKTIDTLKVRS